MKEWSAKGIHQDVINTISVEAYAPFQIMSRW
jgi:hypothetical protein